MLLGQFFKKLNIDWILFLAILPILGAGLLTMNSFSGENYFFEKQLIWASISVAIFFIFSFFDFRFLKRTGVLVSLFAVGIAFAGSAFPLGSIAAGRKAGLSSAGFLFSRPTP